MLNIRLPDVKQNKNANATINNSQLCNKMH